jgi:hypothetical protein
MHRSTKLGMLSAIGLLTVAALADSVNAQTVINGVGSSAGRQFAGGIPVAMCLDESSGAPRPIHYRSGTTDSNSNRHTWICNITYTSVANPAISFTNAPVIIRYEATESGDGFVRLSGQYGTAQTALYITTAGTCGPANTVTINRAPHPDASFTFDEHSSCTEATSLATNFGASDVRAAAFGQTGPIGVSFPPAGQAPVSEAGLSTEAVAALPFAMFIGNGIFDRTGAGGTPGQQVNNLTREQVVAIFNRNVRTWDALGYGALATLGNPGAGFDANQNINLCMREAGSGSKAAFDQTMMVLLPEVIATDINGGVTDYGASSGNVASCITLNPTRTIGYLNAETIVTNAHPVLLNGMSSNYAAGSTDFARKRDIACGRYVFWTDWRIIRRTANDGTPANNLIQAWADAGRAVTNAVPSGTHWVSQNEMNVQKAVDRGPMTWKTSGGVVPPNPECSIP